MAKQRALTTSFLLNWKNEHLGAVAGYSGIFVVKKEIHAFKKVHTYRQPRDHEVTILPHVMKVPKDLAIGHNLGLIAGWQNNKYTESTDAIANLIIPVGAKLYVDVNRMYSSPDYVKMRANKAQVHSIVRKSDKQQVAFARSAHDSSFIYTNPLMTHFDNQVTPKGEFYMGNGQCADGIHFYINLQAALDH